MKTSSILAWGVLIVIIVALGLYALDRAYPATYSSIFSTTAATSTSSTTTGMGGGTTPSGAVTFYCQQGQINATFSASAVQLDLSDGRYFVLPQVMSGSGVRYEATTTGKDELFENEGDSASLSQDNIAIYSNCVAAHVADAGGGFSNYLDQSGLFSFTFPNSFSIVGTAPGYSTDWMVNATTSGMLLAEVQLPATAMPKTNFVGADFTVGTSADPAAVSSCLLASNEEVSVGSVTINGITFDKFTFNDAGAGNVYNTTSYRIVRDNQCYAIEDTIHSSDIDNYPKGTVTAFNQATIQSELGAIAASFKFLQ